MGFATLDYHTNLSPQWKKVWGYFSWLKYAYFWTWGTPYGVIVIVFPHSCPLQDVLVGYERGLRAHIQWIFKNFWVDSADAFRHRMEVPMRVASQKGFWKGFCLFPPLLLRMTCIEHERPCRHGYMEGLLGTAFFSSDSGFRVVGISWLQQHITGLIWRRMWRRMQWRRDKVWLVVQDGDSSPAERDRTRRIACCFLAVEQAGIVALSLSDLPPCSFNDGKCIFTLDGVQELVVSNLTCQAS